MGNYHDGSDGGIDATAGALVWVRRRNGSWWPGRVLGLDELPGGFAVPPRSGTPIKLLGREDSSMDWYNLDKTTRVKAFRCGEYDEDIEKAKASADNSIKKTSNGGKYVRRDDAILHALELESIHCCSEIQKNCPGSNFLVGKIDFDLAEQPKSTQSVVSFDETNNLSATDMQTMQKNGWKTPYDLEDDNAEDTRRTKGLEDLGLVSGRKIQKRGSHRLYLVNDLSCKSKFDRGFSGENNSRSSFSSVKRKQSSVTHACTNSKRKNRHRLLIKVLEGTARMSIPLLHQGMLVQKSSCKGFVQNKVKVLKSSEMCTTDCSLDSGMESSSTSCEGASSDSSENTCSEKLDGNSEMEDDEVSSLLEFSDIKGSDDADSAPHFTGKRDTGDFPCISDSCATRKLHPGTARGSKQCSQPRIAHEGLGETGCSISRFHFDHARLKINKGNPRLKSNIKRRSKYVTLSKTACSEDFLQRADRSGTYSIERSADVKMNGFVNRDCGPMLIYGSSSKDSSGVLHISSPKASDLSVMDALEQGFTSEVPVQSAEDVKNPSYPLPFARYSEKLFTGDVVVSTASPESSPTCCLATLSDQRDWQPVKSISVVGQLYDVKLDVQRSYHGPCVPLVSLMSKLGDKAILGYPVTVEALEDGFLDDLLKGNNLCPVAAGADHLVMNKSDVTPKSWAKTIKMQSKTSGNSIFRPPLLKNKSSSSKKLGFSPRKIRRLSLITVDDRDNEEEQKLFVEKIRGPVVACVPLRLVFSRINEALSNLA